MSRTGFDVELVDQPQAGLDRALPRLRQVEPGEQLPAADAEEVGMACLTIRRR